MGESSSYTYRCAVITGASSGLGEEFARQLAPHCEGLLLVARRIERLKEIGRELQSLYPGLKVWFFASDLTSPKYREALLKAITEKEIEPDLLVNNAGMGDYGEFVTADWDKLEGMLQLNITALTHLTHALLPQLIKAEGGIINVSSLASAMPLADFAVYAASKAYVTNFSEAIRAELRGHNVAVTALCPGPIPTEFGSVAARTEDGTEIPRHKGLAITKEQAVAEALEGLARDRARVYPGWKVAALAFGISLLPALAIRCILNSRPLATSELDND